MACKIIFEARSEYPKCPKCGSPCNVIIDNTRITETHQCWSCDYHRTNDHVQNKSINNNPFYKYNIFIRFIHWLFDDYFINKSFVSTKNEIDPPKKPVFPPNTIR